MKERHAAGILRPVAYRLRAVADGEVPVASAATEVDKLDVNLDVDNLGSRRMAARMGAKPSRSCDLAAYQFSVLQDP